jgi:hypothetical protein
MEPTYYIQFHKEELKRNLTGHDHETRHRSDFQTQFCRTDIFKKSVNNMGIKLYNKLPKYLKNLENTIFFNNQLKTFLLQQTYSIDEYLSYVEIPWKMGEDGRTIIRKGILCKFMVL